MSEVFQSLPWLHMAVRAAATPPSADDPPPNDLSPAYVIDTNATAPDVSDTFGMEASCYVLGGLYFALFLYFLVTFIIILARPGKINLRKRQRLLIGILLSITLSMPKFCFDPFRAWLG